MPFYGIAGNGFQMIDSSQTTLLRIAAFLVDALMIAIALILPASAISYAMAWIAGSERVQIVWYFALAILLGCMLARDGYRGRSPGKHLLGLRIVTPAGEGCTYLRSLIRNLPLLLPPWAAIDAMMVLLGKPRTGDRMARTTVLEE